MTLLLPSMNLIVSQDRWYLSSTKRFTNRRLLTIVSYEVHHAHDQLLLSPRIFDS